MPVSVDNRHSALRVDTRALGKHLRTCLKALGRPRASVDVSLVDDAEIAALNAQYRNVQGPTDVLSFAFGDDDTVALPVDLLGDIVISLDTAQRQAAMVGVADYGLWHETVFLATHGLLHLLGHDHQESAQAELMEALERQLMAPVTSVAVHGLDRSGHGLNR